MSRKAWKYDKEDIISLYFHAFPSRPFKRPGVRWALQVSTAQVILLNPLMMYIMNRLEEKQQAATDERVRKATEATQHPI